MKDLINLIDDIIENLVATEQRRRNKRWHSIIIIRDTLVRLLRIVVEREHEVQAVHGLVQISDLS